MATDDERKRDEAAQIDADEGAEPFEEVGPEGCEVVPPRCALGPGERDGEPQECGFSPDEELADAMPIEPIGIFRDPNDGLVRPIDKPVCPAPPFTRQHVVCIEDTSAYVELFTEELRFRGWRKSWRGWWTPGGWRVPDLEVRSQFESDGSERERMSFQPEEVAEQGGAPLGRLTPEGAFGSYPVRPRRERCKHYCRQVFNNDEQPDPTQPGHFLHFSNCFARRSVGGAFMSLMNQAIYACTLRDPPDPDSAEQRIWSWDRERLESEAHKVLVPMFGLPGDEVKVE